jgi:hypothetical protein
MVAGEYYWWIKEAGVKHSVEIGTTQFILSPDDPTEVLSETVIVRVLLGANHGMYALVDPAQLSIG